MPTAHHRLHTLPDADATLLRWLQSCLDELRDPVACLAEGQVDTEAVHQCRSGLRRLRSAFDLARGGEHTAPESLVWTQTFRLLGVSRDEDVLRDLLGPAAWQQLAPWLASRDSGAVALSRDDLPACFAPDAAFMRAWHELAQWLHTAALAPLAPHARDAWRRHLLRRLDRWHARITEASRAGQALDDDALHSERKRCKRLQQALLWLRPHLPEAERKAYVRRLRVAQRLLGEWHDLQMAMARCDGAPRDLGADAATQLAWITHRQNLARKAAIQALRRLSRATPCWR